MVAVTACLQDWPSLFLRPRHPKPLGSHTVGALRARLPAAGSKGQEAARGLLAQVHYPVEPSAERFDAAPFEYFRPEVIRTIAEGYSIPHFLLSYVLGGQPQIDASRVPKRCKDGSGWPILIFSSGLWGSCEMYTQLCRELASSGAVVVALEHEDGSSIVAYDRETGEAIEYIEQPPWPYDTVAFNRPFLEKRVQELESTIKGLKACVSRGRGGDETASSAPGAAAGEAASEAALAEVLRGGDLERMLLVGHSFGSAGVLHCLRDLAAGGAWGSGVRGAVLMDLWPGPISKDTSGADFDSIGAELRTPFVLLQSEFWESLKWYKPSCRRLARAAGCLAAGVVRGTAHHWVSDTHLWAPAWLLRRFKLMGEGEYRRVHCATIRALHASLRALLEPEAPEARKEALCESWASTDPQVLELVELGVLSKL